MGNKNYIITDCVSDLPKEYIDENNIGVIRFYLYLDSGRFMDGYEISVTNVIEHYEEVQTKIISKPPTAKEHAEIYKNILKEYDNIIHFTISSDTSVSYEQSVLGKELLGLDADRVTIIDTKTLSSGMALLIYKAVEMNKNGASVDEIVKVCEELIPKTDVSFVAKNADYLAINERVSLSVARFLRFFKMRPVFYMKNGKLSIARFALGNGYIKRYIKGKLRKNDKIDTSKVFVTYAGCNMKDVKRIAEEVKKICPFKEVIICNTSATVACNCGAGTYGIIFMYK